MKGLERVGVTLAGDSREEWFRTSGGTLVVPPQKGVDPSQSRLQTILPLGALVETLGCKVSWSKRKGLKVVHPVLGPLKTGVASNTCPYVQEEQALRLINELESERLREFEQSVQAMEAELQQVSSPKDPTESLKQYVTTGSRKDLLQAVFAQPYLKQVPEALKVRLCEELPGLDGQQGWKLLKRLPLSRARRRSLHTSSSWVVFLGAGSHSEADPLRLWAQGKGLEYLSVDILEKGGKGWDLTVEQGVWSVLLWAAATGRISAVISSPPYRTWCNDEGTSTTRTTADPWGNPDYGSQQFRESLMMIQDQLLWSISSVARGYAIPFLKEIPASTPAVLEESSGRMSPERFWDTELWKTFRHWARMHEVRFCQGSLGHSWLRPSVLGTNLDLSHLQELPRVGRPEGIEDSCQWCVDFKKEVVDVLSGKLKGPTVEHLDKTISDALKSGLAGVDNVQEPTDSSSSDDSASDCNAMRLEVEGAATVTALTSAELEAWKAHLLRGHVPYRRDCRYCVEGAGLGMQHRKVRNPQAYTLSVDLFGPMPPHEKGRDEQSISGNPHMRFGLVGVFRLPRSTVEQGLKTLSEENRDPATQGSASLKPEDGVLEEEYEPSEPGEWLSDDMMKLIRDGPTVPDSAVSFQEPLVEQANAVRADQVEDYEAAQDAEDKQWDDGQLADIVRDLKSGVELVTLRYIVGLKSKTGADVTAGIQQLILKITQSYPLRILHCDPGTEFASDALARWLPSHGVRLQTTIPTDKQSNGLAERTVGWFKSRARTLLAANDLPATYWPLAMRWASEAHNRAVLQQSPIPAFGQPVLHKLKRPPGAQKELLTRWITARYAAPHLTVPEGHVLITAEGNLVSSKGFRTGTVDPKAIEEANMPVIQEEESASFVHDPEEPFPRVEEEGALPVSDRRLRDKTTVRFVDKELPELDTPEYLSKVGLMDEDVSEATFRRIVSALDRARPSSQDRRGDLTGRFVLGAYSHGGQRRITSLCKSYPLTTQFLNKFLKARISSQVPQPCWSTVMLMHASDVVVHRDHRNEWGTYNYVTCVPGLVQMWVGPPKDPKVDSASIIPDWDAPTTVSLGRDVHSFDPRNYHAVRKGPDWVLVGYTPLGTRKLAPSERDYLGQVGFPFSSSNGDEFQVRVVKSENPEPEPEGSNESPSPGMQGDLQQDVQADASSMLVGWDLSEGASRNYPAVDLPDADLHRFLEERGVEHVLQHLTFLGVEQPEDLLYLFMEDLVEFGIPKQDADRIMIGIHPPGTRRPDNPNNSALTTGEVRLFDREQRQIPWVIQNRTLSQRSPGPPVSNLGVKQDYKKQDVRRVRWDEAPPEESHPEQPSSSSSTAAWLAPTSSAGWDAPCGSSSTANPEVAQRDRSKPGSSGSWDHNNWSTSGSSQSWVDTNWSVPASSHSWSDNHQSSASSSTRWESREWRDSSPTQDWSQRWWSARRTWEGWDEDDWSSRKRDESWRWDEQEQPAASSSAWENRDIVSVAGTQPTMASNSSVWEDQWPTSWADAECPSAANSQTWEDRWSVAQAEDGPQEDPWLHDDPWSQSLSRGSVGEAQSSSSHPGHVWEDEWTPENMPVGWVAPWTTTMPPADFPDLPGNAGCSTDAQTGMTTQVEEEPYEDPPWVQREVRPRISMVWIDVEADQKRSRAKELCPQSCAITPVQVSETSSNLSRIGVHFPDVISMSSEANSHASSNLPTAGDDIEVKKLAETSFTPNVEELLAGLTGPLEVVHQVSPSEVRRHLDKWAAPAQDEVDSLEGMQAIKRHRGPAAQRLLKEPGVELLPAKGVFTVKPGKPFRRKVRIVSCGNFAKSVAEDVLYASGAAAETLRTVLVHAGSKRRSAWATDIKNAFLLAPIPKSATKRYALKPPTILILLGICDPTEVWEVCRALYGFKEAPKWWAQYRDEILGGAKIDTPLGQATLRKTICDDNLWKLLLQDNTCIAHVLVYVDDLLILACRSVASALFQWIRNTWSCSDLEQAQVHKPLRFLGVDLYEIRDEHGVCGFGLAQGGYIEELVRSHNLSQCARAIVPVPKEWIKDAPPEERGYSDEVLRDAQRITGELLWVSQRTRIDVCFAVGLMSSWTVRSPSFVTKLGLRILAYLANTKDYRLVLTPKDGQELEIFTDASFAPFSDRSISGIVVQLSGRCIFWKSRRQTLVSLSTAESELIAACEGVVLGQSIEALISELLDGEVRKELRVDNVAAITLAEGGGSQRTRHLRVRASFLKEMIDKGSLQVLHCPGEVQLADCLTKALAAPRLQRLNLMLGICAQEELMDPSVQAMFAANSAFRTVDSGEGQSMMLILALLMAQVTPVASQDDEDEASELGLDLWIIGSMMALSLLFVWELGKHCLRECIRTRANSSVCSVRLTEDENRQRRERRQDAVRRAIERGG